MRSDTRLTVIIVALLLALVGAAGLGTLAWTGSRDLTRARVVEAELEAKLDAVTRTQLTAAARLSEAPGVDTAELDALRAELEAAERPEAKVAAASRLAAALSRALDARPVPATEAEQEARTRLAFEVVRAQERVLALQAEVEAAQEEIEEAEGSLGGRVAKGLGLGG
ncbi:MAG: hypothetical protein H6741_16445 [Alphaproteobacteria bacterium]|nr:hypothetical protein [Alphaproteobacteria bacterium]